MDRQLAQLKRKFTFLTEHDLADLKEIASVKTVRKREGLFYQGNTSSNVAYVISGMIRGYLVDQNGDEKTIFLTDEDLFIAQPELVFNDFKSNYILEAVIDSEVLLLHKERLLSMGIQSPNIARFINEALLDIIKVLVSRVESHICHSPEKRYLALIEKNPIFFKKALNKHLASYLGISAVSLSRIVNRILHNRN